MLGCFSATGILQQSRQKHNTCATRIEACHAIYDKAAAVSDADITTLSE